MEVKIMSQAGPEKRTIKATCEQRLPQSNAQARGFMPARYQASTELEGGHGAVMLGTPPPVCMEGHIRQLKCMQKDGFREQRYRLRGSGGSS